MATTLGRFGLAAGGLTSVTVTAAYKVSENEALVLYTESAVAYADVFHVPDQEDLDTLVQDFGDGDTLQAIIQPGSGDSSKQANIIEVRTLGA